jgi:hypothetical protein
VREYAHYILTNEKTLFLQSTWRLEMRIRTIVTPLVIVALALSLSGCGAGSNASTRLIKKVTDGQEGGINKDDNNISLRNFLLVAQPDGSAVVVGTVINAGANDDALLGLAVGANQAVFGGVSTISQNQTIRFEGETANAKAVIVGANLKPGANVELSLFFGKAGEITFNVLVREQEGIYAEVISGLAPSAEPTA